MPDPSANRFALLAWPAYLTALVLIVFPTVDMAMTVYPPNYGGVAWRFAAVGLFSGGLATPLLGVLLALATAIALAHRWMVGVVGALTALFGVLLIPMLPMFALDSLQMQSQLAPDAAARFQATWLMALLKVSVLSITAIVIAVAAFRSLRRRDDAQRIATGTRTLERPFALQRPVPAIERTGPPVPEFAEE